MDPRSKELFDRITEKPVEELTSEDKAFLQARRSYLSKVQKEEYKSILKEEIKEKKSGGNLPEQAEQIIGDRDLDQLSSGELRKVATRLGIPQQGTNRQELLVAISTKMGPDVITKPE